MRKKERKLRSAIDGSRGEAPLVMSKLSSLADQVLHPT